jgi:predicted porin
MNRSLLLAALATLATGSALAQSNVTIYGRLNVSVERQKLESTVDVGEGDIVTTSDSIWALQNSSSRIGFKGTEDLGGGLKASFLIEHGFSPDTGAANATFWGRESWVALEGGFGKVRLGNMGPTAAYFATADYISMHNHDTGTSSDAFYLYPGDARNTIAYTSPSIGGFVGEVQVGLKETTTSGSKNTFVLAGNYDAGPLHLGVGFVNAPVGSGTANTGDTIKEFGIRGLYELGAFTFGAYFINNRIEADAGGEAKRNSYRVSAMYAVGASEFHANFGVAGKTKVDDTTIIESAKQFTLGYNYNLSKRTRVYAFYTALSGDGREAYSTSVGPVGFKNALAMGVRHNF